MANPTIMQKKNGKYLWFALLGLGFQPDAAKYSKAAGKNNVNIKYINLGPNMFDKPNKDAFYIVTHFLLEKLNPARFKEAYRYCWPVLDPKADAEFRKVTCAWLREIMDETARSGSKVAASLFLSPGGPKFISLMLHLASHVMLLDMKTFATDDSWAPEAAAMPTSSLDVAVRRLNLITGRFLKTAVDQDRFLHDYQRKAQFLVKSMREIRSAGAKYDDLLKRYSSDATQEGASQAEKITQVRSLWSAIDEMLATTKEEQHAVDSVLKGDVDQYTLDGTDRVLRIPRCLLERVEQLPHQLSSGRLYEAGQLNLLCALELMNHALLLLKEERRRVAHAPQPQLNPDHLQEKCQQMSRALQNIHLIRQKISKEGIPEVRSAIRELEAEWDRKWRDTLKSTPLVLFLNEDRAPGFLSPMAPLSFEPATEASCRGSVFSHYPATLQDHAPYDVPAEKPAHGKPQENVQSSTSNPRSTSCPATAERTESPAVTTEASSQANTSLDWLFDTPPSPSLRTPSAPPPKASVRKTSHAHAKVSPKRTKTQILDIECDNLADQFADAVTTAGVTDGDVTGLDLEELLITLHGDPFSTRKQLRRTPDSLIKDVKSSWRKALEEDKAERLERSIADDNSVIGRLTPLDYSDNIFKDCAAPSPSVSCCPDTAVTSHRSAPVSQQGFLLEPTRLWETINAEALDSPSGTGSSAALFSLDHETLPEMSGCDSLLSLSDDDDDDDALLFPSLKPEATRSPRSTRHRGRIQQARDNGSFVECLLSDHTVSGLDRDWPVEPVKSVEDTDKVFSLDLDTLGTPSPPKIQDCSLPKLITFSPIDDMSC